MMDKRDELKKKAVELSASNTNEEASGEEIKAWEEYRKLRNLINNAKKNDEIKYKKKKVEDNFENIAGMWSTIKGFMNWKFTGTQSQITKNNVLYRKA